MMTLFVSAQPSVLLENVPHVMQKPDFCGEACAEMWLRHEGVSLDQDDVFAAGGVDPALGRGLWTRDMVHALRKLGFNVGPVWSSIDPEHANEQIERELDAMIGDLRAGVPSIICMHYDDSPQTTEHFRLVLGWDASSGEIIYHEPAVKNGAYRRMKKEQLIALWPLKYDYRPKTLAQWTLVRMRLERVPMRSTPDHDERSHTPADFAQHVMELKQRLPSGFSIVIEPPFVVLGDEPEETVRARAKSTVRWAVDKLKADYFSKDPNQILDVWLFKDKSSYERNVRKLFNETPSTPFGYYSSRGHGLIMNISTGGGTLVHEIVHPFIEANFPDCPPWFNEGLGSLYEQSGEEKGRIHGYTNWRLAGLQSAIEEDAVPTFKELTSMNESRFYDDDTGVNYAAARYLLFYLQERGLLVRFYASFVQNQKRDPTGYQTLSDTLGEKDMRDFERRWKAYVQHLHYGE